MNLYGVVGVLVGILGVHTLCQRCEGIGKASVFLLLGTLLWSEFALAGNVVESLVDINVACCLVENGATGIKLCLHA